MSGMNPSGRCQDCAKPLPAGKEFCNHACRDAHAETLRRFGVDPATKRQIKPVNPPRLDLVGPAVGAK